MGPIDDALPAGTVLGGKYRVGRRLGGGGMGAVYEATHVELGRRVAIKTLNKELRGDRPQVERFQREAIAAARLHHPNIIQVSDFIDREPDPAFLVMEHLDAPNLQEIAMRGPIPVARLGGIALQVLAALEAAHSAGIVHRDLKPANVIVIPLAGGGDLVKLIDFGIARLAEGEGWRRLTQSGSIVGTPVYMSPEQARGLAVDARTDLYALGVALYRIIGGRPPFVGSTLGELMPQILGMEPPPLWDLAPDVPRAFADVIHRSLRKKPEERFASASAMAEAMRAALDAPGATAGPAVTAPVRPVIPPTRLAMTAPSARPPATVPRSAPAPRPAAEPSSTAVLPATRAPVVVAGVAALLAAGGITAVLAVMAAGPEDAAHAAPAVPAFVPVPEPEPAAPEAPLAPPAAPEVVRVDSAPPNAAVFGAAGEMIGNTPLELERPDDPRAFDEYEVRAAGYRPQRIRIVAATSTDRPLLVTLEREEPARPRSPVRSGDARDDVVDPFEVDDPWARERRRPSLVPE